MSKAILVMDMPKQCIDCKLSGYTVTGIPCCKVYGRVLDTFMSKPNWCPLREVPQKKEKENFGVSPLCNEFFTEFNRGYNACIDEILKGSEENG